MGKGQYAVVLKLVVVGVLTAFIPLPYWQAVIPLVSVVPFRVAGVFLLGVFVCKVGPELIERVQSALPSDLNKQVNSHS